MPPPPTPTHTSPTATGSGPSPPQDLPPIPLSKRRTRIRTRDLSPSSDSEEEAPHQQRSEKTAEVGPVELDVRERASRILGSWELLAWYAQKYGESIPQTRLRFQKEMIGLEARSRSLEWKDEVEGGKRKEDKEKEKMRGAGWRNGDLSGGKRKASERG